MKTLFIWLCNVKAWKDYCLRSLALFLLSLAIFIVSYHSQLYAALRITLSMPPELVDQMQSTDVAFISRLDDLDRETVKQVSHTKKLKK